MLLDPTIKYYTLGIYFKFKMAAKIDYFRRIPISGNILVKNICEIPRYMLFYAINTILIL